MHRPPFEEPIDAWCDLCGSHGEPAGVGYCEECRRVRRTYLVEIARRDLGYRARRAVYRVTGVDPGRGILTWLMLGAIMALGTVLVTLSG